MKVEIDENLCVGCGLCEENLPEIFRIGDYTAVVRKSELTEDYRKKLQETVDDCPVDAISIS